MIQFFKDQAKNVFAVQSDHSLSGEEIRKLQWLFSGATLLETESVEGYFIGPRREMITPWSTNAVDITVNLGIKGIQRMEVFVEVSSLEADYDNMLQRIYQGLDQAVFTVSKQPDPIQ